MAYGFYGGVHPPTFKKIASDKEITKIFIPTRVVIPLLQHTGSQAEPVVNVGDEVAVGAVIGKATGFISSAVHASISGKVAKISYSSTPVLPRALSVYIEGQSGEQEFKNTELTDITALSKEGLLNAIKEAGIVGLGGAAFPTHVKLSPPKGKIIDTVILNGAECEPYITCDGRLMMESAKEILKGLEIIAKILDARTAYIAIEDNKPAAINAMEKALADASHQLSALSVKIIKLKTKYPQGAEKQIIKAVLNRIVPAGGLPMDAGCVVQNAATAYAIYEAVYIKKPLIERVITITGPCVRTPMNIRVRIGALITDLVDAFGGFIKEPKRIVVGGPMMGFAQYTLETPVIKGTNGILFLSEDEIDKSEEGVCIRCGKCIEVCPMGLAPTTLMYRVKKERFDEARELGVAHCFECGCCAYECPAKIPLVDYMKFGKSRISKVTQ